MAKLPEIKRISREDLQDAPDWIERLLWPLNTFMQNVYTALDQNLTIGPNIVGLHKQLTFRTGADYGDAMVDNHGFTPVTFTHSLKMRPQSVILSQISIKGSTVTIYDPVTVQWTESNGVVSVNYITGLAVSTQYTATFLVL